MLFMEKKGITIRDEKPADIPAIRKLNTLAFGQPQEAGIVDKLRQNCKALLSLVAEDEGVILGHVLFSPVTFDNDIGTPAGMGLAPMAVLPERQGEGIGSLLVAVGLEKLKEMRCPFIVVLGHVDYYPRFRFVPASTFGFRCQWEGVPDENFMILVLSAKAVDGIQGELRYRNEFDAAM